MPHPRGLGFLPVFIRRALRGQPVGLYGDGRQLRDCLHVDDVVAALALTATTAAAAGNVFNVGHPDAIPLQEIADLVATAGTGSEIILTPWPDDLAQIDVGKFAATMPRPNSYSTATRHRLSTGHHRHHRLLPGPPLVPRVDQRPTHVADP